MIFDFMVLCLSAYKLAWYGGVFKGSPLATLLFTDGLVYFLMGFCINLLAVIFMTLKINIVMEVILNDAAPMISTIAACRAVRRLTRQALPDNELSAADMRLPRLTFPSMREHDSRIPSHSL
ncbi:hypothetical protein HGRIS_000267 [Hohenbuehelia grisea]|uniref:Uncharacterized protein n=1 Tax=Hohenbuehelia grisea TaxID=104357 RepID=A0ABR3JQP5_9AGAR